MEGDNISKGYVEQCIQQLAYKRYLKREVPVKCTASENAMRKAKKKKVEHAQQHPDEQPTPWVVKKDEWEDNCMVESEM